MIQKHSEIKICIICVWFGKWPSYFIYFLETCAANKEIDWVVVSDQEPKPGFSENITFQSESKLVFLETASRKLGFDISIEDPYKLCDFKPAFGKIFEEKLLTYKYWGYCDLDMVFGDVCKHIYPIMDAGPDIVSFYHNFLSGPFCLYKNTQTVNDLFRDCPAHQSILQNPSHHAFDENIPRKIPLVRKSIYQLLYILKLIFIGPRHRFHIPEIRYHFQWYAKKRISLKYPPQDMTEAVHKAIREKNIRAVFMDLIRSDRAFSRQGRKGWKISWQPGKLSDTSKGEDIFAYHFVDSKNKTGFVINPCDSIIEKFTLSENSIECS